jgi:hypothetical protein
MERLGFCPEETPVTMDHVQGIEYSKKNEIPLKRYLRDIFHCSAGIRLHKRVIAIAVILAVVASGIPLVFMQGDVGIEAEGSVPGITYSEPEDLILSGLLSDPLEGESEFVEIYNPTYDPVQINGIGIMANNRHVFRFLESDTLGAMMTIRIIFGEGSNGFNTSRMMFDRFTNTNIALIPDDEGLVELVSKSGDKLDCLKYSRDGHVAMDGSGDLWTGDPAEMGVSGTGIARTSFLVPSTAEQWMKGSPIINEIAFGESGFIEIYNPGGQIDLDLVGFYGRDDFDLAGKLEQETYLVIPLTSYFEDEVGSIGSSMIWHEPVGLDILNDGQIGVELNGDLTDYVRFARYSGDGVESTPLHQRAVSQKHWSDDHNDAEMSFTAGDVVGRNHLSTDTNSWNDWNENGGRFSNGPTRGSRNVYSICFLKIDGDGAFTITNFGDSGLDLSNLSLLNWDGSSYDLPNITLPPIAELKLVPNQTGTNDLDLSDLIGTFHIPQWKGEEGDHGLTLIVLETGEETVFIDMATWSSGISRSWLSDAADWLDDNVVQPVRRTVRRVAQVVVNGIRRSVNWVRQQFTRLQGVLESKLREMLEDGIDVGDYLNLSLTIIKDGWRFTVSASTPEAQLRFPPFPALSLMLSAEGNVWVQKDCNGLTFGGELVLRAHLGFKEDWEVVEIRLTGGVALIINYPDEATVADSHCSSVNAAVGFTLNLEFWASISQPQLDLSASFKKSWELWKDSIPVGPKGYGCDCDRRPRARADPEPDDPYKPPGATTGGENEPEETFEREFGVSVQNRCDHERQLNITTTTDGDAFVYPQSTVVDMDSGEEITIPTVVISGPSAGPASRPGIGPGDGGGPGGIGGGGGGGKNPPDEKDPKNYNGVTSGKVKKVCEGSAVSFDINVTNIGEVLTEYVTVTMTDTTNSSYTNSTTFPLRFKEAMELLYDAPAGWEVEFYRPGFGYVDDIKGLDKNETRQLRVVVKVPEGTAGGNYTVTIRVRLRDHNSVSDSLDLHLRVVDELNIIWQDGFESTPGPWNILGDFQFGPPILGPGSVVEGANAATTLLGTNYDNDSIYSLISEDIPIDENDREGLTLSFWHYVDVQGIHDNCTVWINTENGPFMLDKFTQDISSWNRELYDLSNLSAGSISMEFRFETDPFFNDPGWFIDNVSLLSCGIPSDLSIQRVGQRTYNVTNQGNVTENNVDVLLFDYLLSGQVLYSTAFLQNEWTLTNWKQDVVNYEGRYGPVIYRHTGWSGSAVGPLISLERSETPLLSFDLYQTYDPEDFVELIIDSPNKTMVINLNGSMGKGWHHLEYDLSDFSGEVIRITINQTLSPDFNDIPPVAISDLIIREGYAVLDHTDALLINTIAPGETVTIEFDHYVNDIPGKHLRRAEVLRTCDRDLSDNIDEKIYWSDAGMFSGLKHFIPNVLSPGEEILIQDSLRWSDDISVILETSEGNISLGSDSGKDGWAEFMIPLNAPGGDCSVWIVSTMPNGNYTEKLEGKSIFGPAPVDLEMVVTGNNAGEPISFSFDTGGSLAGVLNVLWDFGEGNLSALEMAEHVFRSTGNFTITLMANFERYGLLTIIEEIDLSGNISDVMFNVSDEIGQPIEGALVTIGSISGVTSRDGWVQLKVFRSGSFEWKVEGPMRHDLKCYEDSNGTIEINSTGMVINITLSFSELPFTVVEPADLKIRDRTDVIILNFTGELYDNHSDLKPFSMRLAGEPWDVEFNVSGTSITVYPNGGMYYGKDVELIIMGGPSGPLWEDGTAALCRNVTYTFTWEIPEGMMLFGPLEEYEGPAQLNIVGDDRSVDYYGSDFSGTFLIPEDSEGKLALFDSDYFGISLEGTISEEDGRLTLKDTLNASLPPEVEKLSFGDGAVKIEFSQVMKEGTEEFDIDLDGLKGDFRWEGRMLTINITGGYMDNSRESYTIKVLSTATSMWGISIKEEKSLEIQRKDLIVHEKDEDDDEDGNIMVWIVVVILIVLFSSFIVLFILSRRASGEDEEDWEE